MSREHRPPLRLVADTAGQTGHQPATRPPDPSPAGGLIVAAEVAHAIGAASVMRMRADATLTEYECPFCELPGRIRRPGTDPTGQDEQAGAASVVALCYVTGLTIVRFAHPECSPSTVLRVLREHFPTGHRVRAACWLPPAPAGGAGGGGRVPLLLVDNQVRAWDRAGARLAEELYPKALRAAGFAPWTGPDATPPQVPDLTATITPLPAPDPDQPGSLDPGSTDPDGVEPDTPPGRVSLVRVAQRQEVVFDGCLDVPDAWADAAATCGRVVVVAGTALTDPGPVIGQAWTADPDRLPDALAAAVDEGRAWAGVATLHPAPHRHRGHVQDPHEPPGDTDSPGPREGIQSRFPGIGEAPHFPSPPDPAANAEETAPSHAENVSAIRPGAARVAGRWTWSGYRS